MAKQHKPEIRGPKMMYGEIMRPVQFRATEAHVLKLEALGGAGVWIRAQLDATPWPKGTKPK